MSTSVVRLPLLQAGGEQQRPSLLDKYLREQQSLTAVDRFAKAHDETEGRIYRDLIPECEPGEGQQYAFEVDLDKCTSCKACVTACHSMNGLDEDETWRAVGLLHGGSAAHPIRQAVTTACHHCVDPACLHGCPVGAYEKDSRTGIVKHLDDQCIGCQYCTLMCPYDVPQYSERLGIVRKCDMCSGRLQAGEAPACVQGCPNQAIAIAIVDKRQALEDAQGDAFLPGAPSPAMTVPTTVYKTERALPRNLLPANFFAVVPSHHHKSLVVMLVLTELSVGAFGIDRVATHFLTTDVLVRLRPLHSLIALSLGLVALGASVFHLGRPRYAFRALIGLRTSWVSREILAFGLFAMLAVLYAASFWNSPLAKLVGVAPLSLARAHRVEDFLGNVVTATGLAGVVCSVLVYDATKRVWGSAPIAGFKFGMTTVLLGLATTILTLSVGAAALGDAAFTPEASHLVGTMSRLLCCAVFLKLVWEAAVFRHLGEKRCTDLQRTARLMKGDLGRYTFWRFFTGGLGGLLLPWITALHVGDRIGAAMAMASFTLLVSGEMLERALFFRGRELTRDAGRNRVVSKKPPGSTFARALKTAFFEREGPLTRDLVREPGGFGLGQVPTRTKPDATTSMICGYCSTGCSLDVHLRKGEAINLSPTPDYVVNRGTACPKGWEALTPLAASDRAITPLLRDASGGLAPVDWETALAVFTKRAKAIVETHGPESFAFIGTGQLPSEELALLGGLTKFGMGLVHGDGNTRQCMATAVVAYKESFGFDAPPYTYKDFEESDVLVFVGANPCIAHPILWERVCKNPHHPIIVAIDPRRTETAMAATVHIPLRPKSDLVLFYGLANRLIAHGWVDRAFIEAHTTGFEAFAAHVAAFTPERVVEATGLLPSVLEQLAEHVHRGKRVSFWWTMGVNQSHEGVRLAQAIIDIALMTGNIGRPGTGANSITGQCNAMGSRLFSNTTNLLGGHDFTNVAHRKKVANILGIDENRIPAKNSLAYDQILEGVLKKKIRGLWIVGTNTAHSWINQGDAHDILGRLEFLVVQDMYSTTETAVRAHLVLPAAGWGEKEGTFINSERRIGVIKRVARAPGEALADFYIFKLIAEAWGVGDMFRRWSSPEAVFQLLKETTRGQPCDITGIEGYEMIDRLGGVQWPLPEGESVGRNSERRLFEDGHFFHPDRSARFLFEEPRALPEPTNAEYPFTLLTGRGSASVWHTQTRTSKSAVLRKLGTESPYVELSPVDAAELGIAPRQWVEVSSRRGSFRGRAFVTHGVSPKQVFVPMHYARANQLTLGVFDPYSRQPSYKACAVSVRPLLEEDRAGDEA